MEIVSELKAASLLQGVKDFCRICCVKLDKDSGFVSAHDELYIENENFSETITPLNILRRMINIDLEITELPDKICNTCNNKILQFYCFRKQILSQETKFKEMVQNINKFNMESSGIMLDNQPIDKGTYLFSYQAKINQEGFAGHCKWCKNKFKLSTLKNHIYECPLRPIKTQFSCGLCSENYVFYSENELQVHVETVHPVIIYLSCHICGKQFQSALHLNNHIKTHPNLVEINRRETFECCGTKFKTSGEFLKHRRIHIKIKDAPFNCPHCDMIFKTDTARKTHYIKYHIGNTSNKS